MALTVPAVPTGMNTGVGTVAMRGVQHAGARGAVGGRAQVQNSVMPRSSRVASP